MEISPVDFCQDLAILIIEGRVPECTSLGRQSGLHCWPIPSNATNKCCELKSESSSAVSMFYFTYMFQKCQGL